MVVISITVLACDGVHRPHNATMDGGDFGGIGGGNERPGHGYFAGQDRRRDLARELRKVRRAKHPRPWWAFWRAGKSSTTPTKSDSRSSAETTWW